MRKMLIFVVETKSEKDNSDGIYIKETLKHYYEYNDSNTIIRFVFMGGKGNYNKSAVESKIKSFVKKAKFADSETQYRVFYVFDKDNILGSPEDKQFENKVIKYCKDLGYSIIWMNKDIEDVYLGRQIADRQKVAEASKFRSSNSVEMLNIKNLTCADVNRRHSSNILNELDSILERKYM